MSCRLPVDPHCPDADAVAAALAVLRGGGVLAYPTDTVYGLAVDAMNPDAIARLYRVKQRPAEKAVPVIIGALEQLSRLVVAPSHTASMLMAAFWPGPLTLLMVPHACVPAGVRGDSARIGVRWPRAVLCQRLALGCGAAITATSANLSGAPAALTASEVLSQFGSAVDLVLDGGSVPNPVVSTILDVAVVPPRLVRAGRIAVRTIETLLGCSLALPADAAAARRCQK